jgi:hypothetical protein
MSNINKDCKTKPWFVMWRKWIQFIFKSNTMFLGTNNVKCNNFMAMETYTLFDFNVYACSINKELMWQNKLALVKEKRINNSWSH